VQLVLGLGLAPITLAWFQQVSLVAPLSNLLAVPVFSIVVMPLTMLGTALLVPAPAAGALLLRLAADAVQFLLVMLEICAQTSFSVWEPPFTGIVALVAATCGAAVLCWWRPVPLRLLALGLLLPALAGVPATPMPFRVTVMDVGQGLAVLVQTAQHAMLYDAGPAYRLRDAGTSVVLPVLHQARVARLDAFVISHDDQDHRGGARSVLAAYPPTRVIAPHHPDLPAHPYQACEAGLSWEWDGVRFIVLSPARGTRGRSDNDDSCVLRIEAPGASVLLTGDIERRREDELARRDMLSPVDLVLAPHHGSRSSSGAALVAATRPRFVVFSAGYLNRWGFPAQQVVRRWSEAGACLLDTAMHGAMVFSTGADGILRLTRRERADGAHLWTSGAGEAPCAVSGRRPG
jgi:competence protein ComEC